MSIYATTDLHGRLDLYLKIKEFLQPNDLVYFLGDAGDRGLKGWELIKAIYNDPQFIYIKGNHEDMLVDAIRMYLKYPDYKSPEFKLLRDNGGEKTMEDWWLDGADERWVDILNNLPTHAEYRNKNGQLILMSHAGYTPWMDPDSQNTIFVPSDFELLWNRDHFYDGEYEDWLQNSVVIHGHTSIPHLANYLCDPNKNLQHGAYWYDDRRKCCLDNLSAYTDVACLLNLDTFEETIF